MHNDNLTIPFPYNNHTIPFPYDNRTIPFPHKQCYAYDSVPAMLHSNHSLYLIPLIFPRHVYHDDVVVWDGESVGKQNKLGLRLSTKQRFRYHLEVCQPEVIWRCTSLLLFESCISLLLFAGYAILLLFGGYAVLLLFAGVLACCYLEVTTHNGQQ